MTWSIQGAFKPRLDCSAFALACTAPYPADHLPPALAQANGLMRAFTYGTMGPFWDDRRQYIDKKQVALHALASEMLYSPSIHCTMSGTHAAVHSPAGAPVCGAGTR